MQVDNSCVGIVCSRSETKIKCILALDIGVVEPFNSILGSRQARAIELRGLSKKEIRTIIFSTESTPAGSNIKVQAETKPTNRRTNIDYLVAAGRFCIFFLIFFKMLTVAVVLSLSMLTSACNFSSFHAHCQCKKNKNELKKIQTTIQCPIFLKLLYLLDILNNIQFFFFVLLCFAVNWNITNANCQDVLAAIAGQFKSCCANK